MNYLDANIIIYALSDTTLKGESCRKLVQTQRFATSIMSLDEVCHILRKKSPQTALNAVTVFLKSPNLILVPFDASDIGGFIEYQKKGLKPRDAIHALSAKKAGCRMFYSEDVDFDKIGMQRRTPW